MIYEQFGVFFQQEYKDIIQKELTNLDQNEKVFLCSIYLRRRNYFYSKLKVEKGTDFLHMLYFLFFFKLYF